MATPLLMSYEIPAFANGSASNLAFKYGAIEVDRHEVLSPSRAISGPEVHSSSGEPFHFNEFGLVKGVPSTKIFFMALCTFLR